MNHSAKALDKLIRYTEAKHRLTSYATTRLHYDFGSVEYNNAQKCAMQAASIHGVIRFLLRTLKNEA